MNDVTDPAPAPLAFVDVSTNSGTVRVICEPINEWLAITPDFDMDEDGKTWLSGKFVVVHIGTGAEVTVGYGCIACCRRAGKALAAAVDWSGLTETNVVEWSAAWSEETKTSVALARALEWGCDAEDCEDDDGEDGPS